MILNIWGMVLLFSLFNCWYNGVFTSLHINVEIFVDGLFLRGLLLHISPVPINPYGILGAKRLKLSPLEN